MNLYDQVRIIGQGGRLLNTGRIIDGDRFTWTVAPFANPRHRVRFSKHSLRVVTRGRATRPNFPRIAPCR